MIKILVISASIGLLTVGCSVEQPACSFRSEFNILSKFAIGQVPQPVDDWCVNKIYWSQSGRYIELDTDDSIFTFRATSCNMTQGSYTLSDSGFVFFDYQNRDTTHFKQLVMARSFDVFSLSLVSSTCKDTFFAIGKTYGYARPHGVLLEH